MQQAPRRVIAASLALGFGIAAQLSAGSVRAAPGETADTIEARLQIDTSRAGSGADVLYRRIEERANVALRHAKIIPGADDDPLLVISVRELAGEDPGYAVSFELRAGDGSSIAAPVEVECSLCTETELVARVEAELDAPIAALREHEPSPEPELAPSDPAPAVVAPTDASPGASAGQGMLVGGVTLLVVGVASLGAGVGLVIPEPRIDEDNPLDLITTRPIGYACLAGGVVLAATGAALTAIAQKRRRASMAVAPFAGPGQVGLVIGGKF